MTFPAGVMIYTQGFGSKPQNVEIPTIQTRVPNTTDVDYPIGKRWIVRDTAEYTLVGLTSLGGILIAN